MDLVNPLGLGGVAEACFIREFLHRYSLPGVVVSN